MRKCMSCGQKIGLIGICKLCGLSNNVSKKKKDGYHLAFGDGSKWIIPLQGDLSLEEFLQKNKNRLAELVQDGKIKEKELKMNESGYFKGKMCPFTMAKVGGTRAATLAFTGATMNEYVWTHNECIEEYCAIWDETGKQCGIKTISKKLKIV